MKIRFLGTAAAEGVPAIFCQCDVCRRSRQAGGKNLRTRSQALVDDKLLIDFGPDTYWHSMTYGIDLSRIENCLITHSHSDHLYPDDLSFRRPGYAHIEDGPKFFNLFGSRPALELLRHSDYSSLNADDDASEVRIYPKDEFETFWVGEFLVTALPASHGTESPYIYMVKRYGKTLLYAHDTTEFKPEVWEYFAERRPHFDIVTLDCTKALQPESSKSHMNFSGCVKMRNMLRENGYIDGGTKVCVNHFSHNGLATYDDLVETAEKENMIVTYDGLTVEA